MCKKLLIMSISLLFFSGCATRPEIQEPLKTSSVESFSELSTLRNISSPFQIDITSNKKSLVIGDLLKLKLQTEKSGFANLITISSSGKIASLLEDKWIDKNKIISFPDQLKKVDYQLQSPSGIETYILIISNEKLNWINNADILHHHLGLTSLNLNRGDLIDRISNITSQLPHNNWNTNYIELGLGFNA